MTQTTTALADRASMLTHLMTLASELGGSIRVEKETGAVFYGQPDGGERAVGDSVSEAINALSAERQHVLTAS